MDIGETHILYIHPALAYGLRTFSEKNIYLEVKVILHDFTGILENTLTEIEDKSFILQPQWLEKETRRHEMALKSLGQKLAKFYQQIPALNLEKLRVKLHDLMNQATMQNLNQEEKLLVNKVFFDLYVKRKSD